MKLNMKDKYFYLQIIISFVLYQTVASTVLERLIDSASSCEVYCDEIYPSVEYAGSCKKGCRLFTIIELAKDLPDTNMTITSCYSACTESYMNISEKNACESGCKKEASVPRTNKNSQQTLHLLTPLMYVRSAYNTVAHHVKQLITTSWTLYVQEDSGRMVVLQTHPKIVMESSDHSANSNLHTSNLRTYRRSWQEERPDWMDCISHQSGLPRWLLVVVLFGFIIALLWLCCATTVTAPNQHLSAHTKKIAAKNDLGYLLICDPVDKVKIQPPCDEEAPPLPPKVTPI